MELIGMDRSQLRNGMVHMKKMAVFILEDALSVQTDNASLVVCV